MGTRNYRFRFSSILIAVLIICSGLSIISSHNPKLYSAKAVDTWEQTFADDFQTGTLKNLSIESQGDDADLRLKLYNSWEDVSPATGPNLRYSHNMATICGTEQVLLFGGTRNKADTWVFDLETNTWSEKYLSRKPLGRQYHAMSAIHGTDNVLLFGGINWGKGTLNDTWMYDFGTNKWNEMELETFPTERGGASMCYVFGTDKVVLFGGQLGVGEYFEDTWVYDVGDSTWVEKSPKSKPNGRQNHAMAPVYGTEKIVLFGGYREGVDDETWVYDANKDSWEYKSTRNSPKPRSGHAMAPIHGDDKVILFGGSDSNIEYDDTWVYDLSDNTWTKQAQSKVPQARSFLAMASLYDKDKVVMFGGTDTKNDYDDTWVYHNSIYTPQGTYISPVFDTHRATLFGTISCNAELTVHTSLEFQLRTAAADQDITTKTFVGPDGNPWSYYTSLTSELWSGHDGDRWVQYKVYFYTKANDESPILEDVKITYNVRPGKPILGTPANGTWVNQNKPTFIWQYNGSQSSLQGGFQVQIDNNYGFSSIDFDSGKVTSGKPSFTYPEPIPDGNWYWRVRTYDHEGAWGEYSEYSIIRIDTNIDPPVELIIDPPGWSSKNSFWVDWVNPEDPSGFQSGAYFYVGTEPPTSGVAGAWATTKPFQVTNSKQGENNIYVWLEDMAGNKDHKKYTMDKLKLDTINPTIVHRPVTQGTEGKQITITAEVNDQVCGINEVRLYYKKAKDSKFTYMKMVKSSNNIYSTSIPSDAVSSDGMEYYIKAADKATPPNEIFYGRDKLTDVEPNEDSDIFISISKEDVGFFGGGVAAGIIGVVIAVIIILVAFYIIKHKKKTSTSDSTIDYSGQAMDPRRSSPAAVQSLSQPQPMPSPQPAPLPPPPTPPPVPMQPQQPKVIMVYKCEACDANLTDPNNCPYCGWSREE